MEISLKKQIVLAFLILIFTISGVDIICNHYFLGDFYLNNKKNKILQVANNIEKNTDNINNTNFLNSLERECNVSNLSLLVVNDNMSPLIYFCNKEKKDEIQKQLKMFIADRTKDNHVVSEVEDDVLNINYLQVCGRFNNGCYYIINTPLESINESVSLSTMFLLYVLIILLPVSVCLILFLITRITEPLTKLTAVSKKIANLDFSETCEEVGSKEIIELASNFNKMSKELEKNIGNLKTANIKLKQDLEEKEELEEMRKDFLSSVSHELKTPIAIISGYSESLKEGIEDKDDVIFFSETIYEETQKLSKMVKQILQINKTNYMENDINITKENLIELINSIITPMQKVIEEKNVTIINNISSTIFTWTDKTLLSQIISNYITNAIDHVNINGIIRIDILTEKEKNKLIVFNTGSHIPEDCINKIWEKFYKIDKSRNRDFGGTGLGLSIVSTYSKKLDIECGVRNINGGVEFFITIDI